MAFPSYTSIFSGGGTQAPKPSLAGNWATKLKELQDTFPEGISENMLFPLILMQQQENAERMGDPANITRQLEAMEAPLGRMAQQAAGIQAQKDARSLTGNLLTKAADTFNASLGAKFAYDQPVFTALGSSYAPNPYAYGVLNRRGGVG